MKKMEEFRKYLNAFLLLAVCAMLLSGTIDKAYAYFSTYAEAKGGYTFTDDTDINETIDGVKHITVTSSDKTTPVFVRVTAVTASQYEEYIGYEPSDDAWVDGGDGYWYYTRPLVGKDETSVIDVYLKDVPEKDEVVKEFKLVVVYEKTPAEENVSWQDAWKAADGGAA